MNDTKKRKIEEGMSNGEDFSMQEQFRFLLEPLTKCQLVDLLSRLGSQYPSIAEEIEGLASTDTAHRKLFVRGLSWNTSSAELCAAFQEYGDIEEGAVIYDKATGKSRGYGFITFKTMESARNALKSPTKLIDGRMAACNLACEGLNGTSFTPDLAQRKLYIGCLSPDITSEVLLKFFSRHGEIEEGSVAYDKESNESRGFGFVTYKFVEAAKKALDDPYKILGGRNIIVKLADTRGKMLQSHLPGAVVQVPLTVPAGYIQPVKAPSVNSAIGYTYPQRLASYPSSYPNPAVAVAAAAAVSCVAAPTESQLSYASVSLKKDSLSISSTPSISLGGYQYYVP